MPSKFSLLRFGRYSRRSSLALNPAAPRVIPLGTLIDEENIPGYSRDTFYHPNPGDVLNHRYELKAKIGWGSSSTVWLAQDVKRGWLKPRSYYAIKINTNNYTEGNARHELDMSTHLASVNPKHWGHDLLVTAVDHFSIDSTKGKHLSLVFEPLREPLWLFRRRLGADKVLSAWLPLIKLYIRGLLYGIDYLHSECHVIHTDLKLDNILMTFEHESVIKRFVQAQLENPMPRKLIGTKAVYLCHNDFGAIRDDCMRGFVPKIADFGLAQRGDGKTPLLHPIQPSHCHAPEVILGTGWSYSADIWNFGIMVWDLLAGQELFQGKGIDAEDYSAAHHLAEMIALIGPVPPKLLQRQRQMRHWRWKPSIPNSEGKSCDNAADYFSGPFFTDDDVFMHHEMIPFNRSLRNEMPACISEQDADMFLSFMRRMLHWIPEERATAKELLQDPWLILSKG